MTKTEITERIKKLAWDRFCLACKDRWLKADWDEDRRMEREIKTLEAQLEEME